MRSPLVEVLLSGGSAADDAWDTGHETYSYAQLRRQVLEDASRLPRPRSIISTQAPAPWTQLGQTLAAIEAGHVAAPGGCSAPTDSPDWLPREPDAALIIASSGSRGRKEVVLGQGGTLANLAAIATTLPLEAGDRLGLTLDLAWAYGLIGQVFLGLSRGACLVECRPRGPQQDPLTVLEAAGVTAWAALPHQLQELARLALARGTSWSPRFLASAGARLSSQAASELRSAFPETLLINQYGLTEAGPRVSAISSEQPAFWRGSVGRALPGVEIWIDPAGELCVRSPSQMLGTLDSTGALLPAPDFLSTGDRAELDSEGQLWIHGRLRAEATVAGQALDLRDLEQKLGALSGVHEVAVEAWTSSTTGSSVLAALRVRDPDHERVARAARSVLRAERAEFVGLRLLIEFPRGPSGKLDRSALRQRLRESASNAFDRRLQDILDQMVGPTAPTDPHLGLDSIQLLTLIERLESDLEIVFRPTDLRDPRVQYRSGLIALCLSARERQP